MVTNFILSSFLYFDLVALKRYAWYFYTNIKDELDNPNNKILWSLQPKENKEICLTPTNKNELNEDEIDELLMAPKKPTSASKSSSDHLNRSKERNNEKFSASKIDENVMKLIKVNKLSESSRDTVTYHIRVR